MEIFTEDQIRRQDFVGRQVPLNPALSAGRGAQLKMIFHSREAPPVSVELHNQIYDLVKRLIPSEKEIQWNIEMIGGIRDTIQHWLVDKYIGT